MNDPLSRVPSGMGCTTGDGGSVEHQQLSESDYWTAHDLSTGNLSLNQIIISCSCRAVAEVAESREGSHNVCSRPTLQVNLTVS